jgi:hypothetical protein
VIGGVQTTNLSSAPSFHEPSCAIEAGGREKVFRIEASNVEREVCLSTLGSNGRHILSVREDCAGDEVACEADPVQRGSFTTLNMEAGQEYFVYVDESIVGSQPSITLSSRFGPCDPQNLPSQCTNDRHCHSHGGVNRACSPEGVCVQCLVDAQCTSGICEFNRCAECRDDAQCESEVCENFKCQECRNDAQCEGDLKCSSNLTCQEDSCLSAVSEYQLGSEVIGNTFGLAALYDGNCADFSGPEKVLRLAGSQERNGVYCFEAFAPSFDVALYLRQGICEEEAQQIACGVPQAGQTTRVQLNIQIGEDYYLFVDSRDLDDLGGEFYLRSLEGPCVF